ATAEVRHWMPLANGRNEQLLDDRPVDVLAAELVVAAVVVNFDRAVAYPDDRGIKRPAAEVVHEPEHPVVLALEAIGQRRGHRLLQEWAQGDARDLRRLARGLTLG